MRILLLILVCASCTQAPSVWVRDSAVTGEGKRDSVYAYTDPVLQLSFGEQTENSFIATYAIEKYNRNTGRQQQRVLTDSVGVTLHFTDETSFINHLASRGYGLIDRQAKRGEVAFTFNKK